MPLRKPASVALSLTFLLLASSGHAASLTVTPDSTTYFVGDTVTLSIVGDSMGAEALSILGVLLFDETILTPVSATQNTLTSFDGAYVWSEGSVHGEEAVGPGSIYAFTQIGALTPYAVDQQLMATVTFTVDAVGSVDIDWLDDGSSQTLDFFGLTTAPGTSLTTIPEPGTAALLSLGLLGLAMRRDMHRGA